jgi:hypothetical protein
MRGLGPRIPISDMSRLSDRDGRDKPGHDAIMVNTMITRNARTALKSP